MPRPCGGRAPRHGSGAVRYSRTITSEARRSTCGLRLAGRHSALHPGLQPGIGLPFRSLEITRVAPHLARFRSVTAAAFRHRPWIEQNGGQALIERLGGNRLHQKFMHPKPDGFDHAGMLAVAGEHEDRNVGIRKPVGQAHLPHESRAINAGHLPIEQHHIGIQGPDGE
jgi:hypothetical protein